MTPSRRLRRRSAIAFAAALAVPGCRRSAPPSLASAPVLDPGSTAAEANYLAPPTVSAVSQDGDGVLAVRGRAPPKASILLASPEGDQAHAVADRTGAWRLKLPRAAAPRLFAVSAVTGGRALHAEGALLLVPGASSPAVTLRAGAAALPLTPSQGEGPDVATVDYDPAGFLAAAGHAAPDAAVTLALDGAPAAAGQADGQGRYALLAAGRRLKMGPHRLEVAAGGRSAARVVLLAAPGPLAKPFAAERTGDGWRVEWALTGGGAQTTLVLNP